QKKKFNSGSIVNLSIFFMLKQMIQSVVPHFSDSNMGILLGISEKRRYQKDEVILGQGKFCKSLWFIEEGAVKAYETIEGTERTTYFFMMNTFFTNYYCWVSGNASDITFKAVKECKVIEIDYPSLERLCQKHHIFDTVGRKMAERIYVQEFQLRKLLLNCTALDRYEYLEQNSPEVFQHFALKDIAGFIGITDVSLSRIRKNRIKIK
nr:Crp/Fnr family transcriptional regulator [Thermoflexibacter sp.]